MKFPTLVGSKRIEQIKLFIKQTESLDGDIVEVGVFEGGTAEVLIEHSKNKQVFLFDTFEGIPYDDIEGGYHKEGDFKSTKYNELIEEYKSNNRVNIIKGIFPDESGQAVQEKKFSLVHLDVDVYKSYKDCLDFLYPKVVKGGVIVFDDYNAVSCLGAKTAIDEFFKDKKEDVQIGPECQAFIVKE